MIDYEAYEQDEIIKPRHVAKKPKTKKSNHKHIYKTEIKVGWMDRYKMLIEICTVCGREGDTKILRND